MNRFKQAYIVVCICRRSMSKGFGGEQVLVYGSIQAGLSFLFLTINPGLVSFVDRFKQDLVVFLILTINPGLVFFLFD